MLYRNGTAAGIADGKSGSYQALFHAIYFRGDRGDGLRDARKSLADSVGIHVESVRVRGDLLLRIDDMSEQQLPPCPECNAEFTYENADLLTCPMCGHEWVAGNEAEEETAAERVVRDSVGNVLHDGDTVTVVKSLKVKGAGGGTIKSGTKVTGIRLITDGVGDHDIDVRVPGFGQMQLKSSVVKKL